MRTCIGILLSVMIFAGCDSKDKNPVVDSGSGAGAGAGGTTQNVPDSALPIYYVGEQTYGLLNKIECYVSVRYSPDQDYMSLKMVVRHPHKTGLSDEDARIGIGPIELKAQFIGGSIQSDGFYYENPQSNAPVKQAIIVNANDGAPAKSVAAIFHDNHHDPVACEGLKEAIDVDLVNAQLAFNWNFDKYVENFLGENHDDEDDHDHEDGDDHDDHEDEDDHDHHEGHDHNHD